MLALHPDLDVVIGVDTHNDTHTAASGGRDGRCLGALDGVGRSGWLPSADRLRAAPRCDVVGHRRHRQLRCRTDHSTAFAASASLRSTAPNGWASPYRQDEVSASNPGSDGRPGSARPGDTAAGTQLTGPAQKSTILLMTMASGSLERSRLACSSARSPGARRTQSVPCGR
jgi:hypothetical protein